MRRPWLLLVGLAGIALLWWLNRGSNGPYEEFWRYYNFRSVALNVGLTWVAICGFYIASGGAKRRTRAARVLLLNCVCLICVLAGEVPVLLYGFDYRATFGTWAERTWLERARAINRPDDELLHIHWPHTSWEGEVFGNLAGLGIPDPPRHAVSVRYDGNGFRNDADATEADVVVIGDSFVEGAIVPLQQTLPRRLAHLLEKTTVNLGQAAYGPQQELVVLERYAKPLKPQLVIWCVFGGNDLNDVTLYEEARASSSHPYQRATVARRSLTRNAILRLSQLTLPQDGPKDDPLARSGMLPTGRVWFSRATAPWTPHQWQVLTETLLKAKETCAGLGRLVVVYVPRKFTVYGDLLTDKGATVATWTRTPLPETMAEWCRERGLSFCDLTPALRRATIAGVQTYHPDDTHWNAEGHRVAAEAIAGFLKQ